jgi:hypothetical protein
MPFMNKTFQIGDFAFSLIAEDGILSPPNFMLFECADAVPQYTYTIRLSEDFPEISGKVIAQRPDLVVFENAGLESRLIGVKGTVGYYACYTELSAQEALILLSPNRLSGLHFDPVFVSLLALERRQIQHDAFILHCAYIVHQGEAILFSAPSETGKSTQGNLWEQYKGAKTINGDRALVQKVNGVWVARGWPVCGSSEICNNLAFPIRSVVMLSQGKTDVVTRLSGMQAFTQIYNQVTINRWNVSANVRCMDLLDTLVREIPVWHLSCTISENAVNTLAEVLYPKEDT